MAKNGLVRVYDVGSNPPTYFLHRGDERTPDTNRILPPGVPAALSADQFALKFAPIKLPRAASHPDQQDFLIAESVAPSKKLEEAVKLVAESEKKSQAAPETAYKSSFTNSYPTSSTGRRLAFANWLAGTNNPLTARVAANQIWLRHFGQALVPTPNDFGRNGRPPSHPQLLDWLAAELMNPGSGGILPARSELAGKMPALRDESVQPWSMKHLHRLIVTSSTYRMASTPDEANAKLDPATRFSGA